MTQPVHIVFLLVEDFTHLAFSCAIEPLRLANLITGSEIYEFTFASEDGAPVRSSVGIEVQVHNQLTNIPDCDFLFVVSGRNIKQNSTKTISNILRRKRVEGVTLGSICTGAYVLAETGLLDGQKAALHWAYHDSFQEHFPHVTLVPEICVVTEKTVTASGGTAATDLMLKLIADRHGDQLASEIADQMVYVSLREPSGQQRASVQSRIGVRNEHLIQAIKMMTENIEQKLTIKEISKRMGVSSRQLERVFKKHLNCAPNMHYMNVRLERARRLLIQTDFSVIEVGIACGFENPSQFSRRYRRKFGIAPSQQRSTIA